MVFTDNTSHYLDLELLAGLPDKLTHSLGKISLQHMVAILGYPDKMVFYFILCMTSLAVFHDKDSKPTASRMLPA